MAKNNKYTKEKRHTHNIKHSGTDAAGSQPNKLTHSHPESHEQSQKMSAKNLQKMSTEELQNLNKSLRAPTRTGGSRNCIDGEEVELWGECYSIADTTWLSFNPNTVTGEIPPEIGQLVNLTSLNLSNQGLTGPIPPVLFQMNLMNLKLQNNNLTGEIPEEICHFYPWTGLYSNRKYKYLYLNGNQLTGTIPECICDIAFGCVRGYIANPGGSCYSYETDTSADNYLEVIGVNPVWNIDWYDGEWYCNECEGILWGSSWFSLSEHFRIYDNNFCGPYPSCLSTLLYNTDIGWPQDTSNCPCDEETECDPINGCWTYCDTYCPSIPAGEWSKFDVNNDGSINVVDVVNHVSHTLGTSQFDNACALWAADVNGDHNINVVDIVNLVTEVLEEGEIHEDFVMCGEDEWRCGSGECIQNWQVCNGCNGSGYYSDDNNDYIGSCVNTSPYVYWSCDCQDCSDEDVDMCCEHQKTLIDGVPHSVHHIYWFKPEGNPLGEVNAPWWFTYEQWEIAYYSYLLPGLPTNEQWNTWLSVGMLSPFQFFVGSPNLEFPIPSPIQQTEPQYTEAFCEDYNSGNSRNYYCHQTECHAHLWGSRQQFGIFSELGPDLTCNDIESFSGGAIDCSLCRTDRILIGADIHNYMSGMYESNDGNFYIYSGIWEPSGAYKYPIVTDGSDNYCCDADPNCNISSSAAGESETCEEESDSNGMTCADFVEMDYFCIEDDCYDYYCNEDGFLGNSVTGQIFSWIDCHCTCPAGEQTSFCGIGETEDCNGNCCPESWIDDNICDDEFSIYNCDFNCEQFNYDGGDCVATCTVIGCGNIGNNCSCDSLCGYNNNCCDDFEVQCPDLAETPELVTCSEIGCGNIGDICSCDGGEFGCAYYNDCCDDFENQCPDLAETSACSNILITNFQVYINNQSTWVTCEWWQDSTNNISGGDGPNGECYSCALLEDLAMEMAGVPDICAGCDCSICVSEDVDDDTSTCGNDQFDCGDGQCIPASFYCDGSSEFGNAGWGPDCSNGSDEGIAMCCADGASAYVAAGLCDDDGGTSSCCPNGCDGWDYGCGCYCDNLGCDEYGDCSCCSTCYNESDCVT